MNYREKKAVELARKANPLFEEAYDDTTTLRFDTTQCILEAMEWQANTCANDYVLCTRGESKHREEVAAISFSGLEDAI